MIYFALAIIGLCLLKRLVWPKKKPFAKFVYHSIREDHIKQANKGHWFKLRDNLIMFYPDFLMKGLYFYVPDPNFLIYLYELKNNKLLLRRVKAKNLFKYHKDINLKKIA